MRSPNGWPSRRSIDPPQDPERQEKLHMTDKTLESVLSDSGDIVELLRNQQTGPNAYPGVPAEYSNWRSEQQAWAKTCVLFNQSYHMVDLEVSGPDAFA